jgi:hypothetical protein
MLLFTIKNILLICTVLSFAFTAILSQIDVQYDGGGIFSILLFVGYILGFLTRFAATVMDFVMIDRDIILFHFTLSVLLAWLSDKIKNYVFSKLRKTA